MNIFPHMFLLLLSMMDVNCQNPPPFPFPFPFPPGAAPQVPNNKTKIHIGAFFLDVEKDEYTYRAGMEVALSLINKDPKILKDYELVIHYQNSLNLPITPRVMLRWLETEPVKQMVLGPALSSINKRIVPFLNFLAIPQVSFSARKRFNEQRYVDGEMVPTSLEKKTYPFLARTAPTFTQTNYARVRLFKQFGWKRIAIVHSDSIQSFEKSSHLVSLLRDSNISVITTEIFHNELEVERYNSMFEKLKAVNARVIVTFFDDDFATQLLFCQAYWRGMYGKKYTWILPNTITPTFYKLNDEYATFNCSSRVKLIVGDGALVTRAVYIREDGVKTVNGFDAETVWNKIKTQDVSNIFKYNIENAGKGLPRLPPPFKQPHSQATRAFDSVYTAALALDRLLKKKGESALLTEYRDREKALHITEELLKTDFEGASGTIKLGGPTMDEVNLDTIIEQYRSTNNFTAGHWEDIAYYNIGKDTLTLRENKKDTVFNDGIKRRDDIYVEKIQRHPSRTLLAVIWSLIATSVVLALIFQSINIAYRKERLIKMSSPNMNSGIVVGCFLLYTAVVLYGIDSRFLGLRKLKIVCNVFPFIMSVGFTFLFGCLFSKTWRVYKIFTAAPKMVKVNTAALRDERLYVLVFVMVFVDLCVSALWVIVSPFDITDVPIEMKTIGEDHVEAFYYQTCSCNYGLHFSITMYCYKGILLAIGSFLAWETRRVRVAALNDSQYIGMAVYNVLVVAASSLIVLYSINDVPTYYYFGYIVFAAAILLSANVTLVLVFAPKLRLLFGRNKTLQRALSVQTFSFVSSTHSVNQANSVRHTESLN